MQNAFSFLIQTLFELYTMVVLLRFLLQLVRADFYNPISQFIVKITNPLLIPLRRIIPGLGGIDMASLILAYGLTIIKIIAISSIYGVSFGVLPLLISAVFGVIIQVLNIVMFAVIIKAIASWFVPYNSNPALVLMDQLTAPFLAPFRRILPATSGIDISPIFLLITIMFLKMLLSGLM